MHPTTTGKQTSWATWLQKNTDLFKRNQGKKTTESVCTQKAKLGLQNLLQTKLQWWSTEEETNRRKTFVSTINQGLKKHSSYKKNTPKKEGGREGGEKKKKKHQPSIKDQSPMRKNQRIMTHFADGEAGSGVSQEDVSSIAGGY
jgi:hypothetical protein